MYLVCLVTTLMFKCRFTLKHVRDMIITYSVNVVYIIFKTRFRIHKSDFKTEKYTCGTAKHFNSKDR